MSIYKHVTNMHCETKQLHDNLNNLIKMYKDLWGNLDAIDNSTSWNRMDVFYIVSMYFCFQMSRTTRNNLFYNYLHKMQNLYIKETGITNEDIELLSDSDSD